MIPFPPRPAPARLPLRGRLEELAGDLRARYSQLIRSALGQSDFRPIDLVDRLGLDKSLASRVSRALRAENPFVTMHEIPTPQGLGMLVDACEAKNADEAAVRAARDVAREYAAFLGEFPGGRSDLDTALGAWLPDLRDKSMRRARRDVFRGWSTVMGLRADLHYVAYAIVPSAEPGRLDTLWITVRQGLRRLRLDEPVEIGGLQTTDAKSFDRRRALCGQELVDDPHSLIVSDVTTPSLDVFSVVRQPDRLLLVLAGDEPDMNEPIDVTIGGQTLAHFPDRACDECSHIWVNAMSKLPVERFVLDLLVHEDVATGGEPSVTRVLDGTRQYGERSRPEDLGPAAQAHGLSFVSRRGSVKDLAEMSMTAWTENIAQLVGARDMSIERFTVHRLREEFPLPTYRTAIWLPLPE